MDEERAYLLRQAALADIRRHKATLGIPHRVPMLRVRFSTDGIMQSAVFKSRGPQDSPEDSWWQAVSRDWRQTKEVPGAQCLGWGNRKEEWTFACKLCGLGQTFEHTDLMKKFGKDYYLSNLSYDAVMCPRKLDRKNCRVTCV